MTIALVCKGTTVSGISLLFQVFFLVPDFQPWDIGVIAHAGCKSGTSPAAFGFARGSVSCLVGSLRSSTRGEIPLEPGCWFLAILCPFGL